MIQDLSDLALGANRVLSYAGYVLLAGTFTFWSVVWPDGRRNRRLIALTLAGIAAMIIGTLAGPAIQLIFGDRLLGDIITPLGGAAQLGRLAALAAAMCFLPDIIGGAVVGWRALSRSRWCSSSPPRWWLSPMQLAAPGRLPRSPPPDSMCWQRAHG
jgi:hypothetical protein